MQRMLQNMPSADYIGKALGIEQSGVESLLQQGKGYLAQQLTQRGVQPGATLASALPQSGARGHHVSECGCDWNSLYNIQTSKSCVVDDHVSGWLPFWDLHKPTQC